MILDLYAGGPSGWSTALGVLGEKALGLEYDARACATRAAIGHLTLRCDIGAYPVAPFFGKVTGITASPPCQTFSTSGKGEGRKHLDRLIAQVLDADWSTDGLDDRTAHVLHTGRWVNALMPEWVCFEQVRAVQSVWDAYAEVLEGWGYSVWTGPLCAADYGTPQTRIRSILVASRVREVAKPRPTHAKAGEGGLPGWVSMAEALGWSGTVDRRQQSNGTPVRLVPTSEPAPTLTGVAGAKSQWVMDRQGPVALVGFPRRADTPSNAAGDDVVEIDGVAYRARDLWPSDGPAPTVTEKARSWQVYPLLQPGSWADGRCGNRRLYEADEPAPAPQFGHDSAGWKWVPGERPSWVFERPCTTICGDPRISPPGRHDPSQSGSQFGPEPVRLQLWEALTIQDFHPELPVQGPRTAAFLQVGNCIPVRLARAVLATVLGLDDGAIQAHSGRGAVPVGAPRGDGAEVGSPASSGGGSASRRPQPTEQPPRQSRGDDSRTARRTPQRPSRPDQGVRSVRGRLRTSPDEASEVEDLFQAMHGGAPIPDSNRAVPGAGECQAQADLPDVQQGVHGGAAAGNDGEVLLASLCSSGAAPSSVVAGVDPTDDRSRVAAAGDRPGPRLPVEAPARPADDRQGQEVGDRDERGRLAGGVGSDP